MPTNEIPGGESNDASGAQNDASKKDTVSYDTHQKLLGEKKRVQARAEELEARVKAFEDEKSAKERQTLEEQKNYQKLLEMERQEKQRIEQEHKSLLDSFIGAKKRQAVLKFISGQVPEPARDWIKTEGVVLREDGSVDEDTAKVVAQDFEKNYSFAVLRDKQNGGLPADAAKGGKDGITYEQWKALPSSKEQMAKAHLIVDKG